ncbi:hypothetical protein Bca4012_059145 [Brassica carinata]
MCPPPDCRPSVGASAPKGTCRWLSPFGGSAKKSVSHQVFRKYDEMHPVRPHGSPKCIMTRPSDTEENLKISFGCSVHVHPGCRLDTNAFLSVHRSRSGHD